MAGTFAAVLGLLNSIVRPILVVLTLPVTLLTLGLFLFVINALLFLPPPHLSMALLSAVSGQFLGSILVSIVTTAGNKLLS